MWRDYCAAGDPICAGGNSVDEHLNYFDLYTEEAAKFVVDKVNAVQAVPKPTTSDKPKPSTTSKAEEASSAAPSTQPASSTATVTVGGSTVVTTLPGSTTTVAATSAVTTSAEASSETKTTSDKPFASEHPQSTMSYVANPTTVVKPTTVASYEAVASEYHTKGLPEATHKPTENLSALPTTAAGVPSVNPEPAASATPATTSAPAASAAPTHGGDIVPSGAGVAHASLMGVAGLAAAAVAALLL